MEKGNEGQDKGKKTERIRNVNRMERYKVGMRGEGRGNKGMEGYEGR